ncbi:MAG: type VI secretion system tip protein TssI/VgrG [Pseudomonadota bacterium]
MAERVTLLKIPKAFTEARVVRLKGSEALSEISRFEIELTSAAEKVKPADVVAEALAFEVAVDDETAPRLFGGIITSIEAIGHMHADRFGYRLIMQSSMVLTTLNRRSRIFQDVDAKAIITQILNDYSGKISPKLSLQGGTGVREYTVQYDETDYDFLCRLMAEEGVYFVSVPDLKSGSTYPDTITIADSPSGYRPCIQKKVSFAAGRGGYASLDAWRPGYRLHTAAHELSDYNPLTPTQDLLTKGAAKSSDLAFTASSRYTYPGRYLKRAAGTTLSALKMEEEEVAAHTVSGESSYLHFAAGATVNFEKPPQGFDASEAVLLEVHHDFANLVQGLDSSKGDGKDRNTYTNEFVAIPSKNSFRPPEPARRLMPGLQTAVVVGPSSADVHVDEHMRIKVKFHWDRDAKADDTASCWIRCVQPWAGSSIGSQFIPRVGMEVLVDFIEGDPDRPIVIGCAYNASNRPPYKLPDNKVVSGFRSITSPNKSGKALELKFVDEPDKELVYFYSGKDFERVVDYDDTLKVTNDRKITVLEGDETTTIEKGDRKATVTKGDEVVTVDSGDHKLTVSSGDQKVSIGKTSTLEAKQKITLKVGQSQIILDPMGVTIKATKITLKGTASVDIKASGMVKIDGAMTEVGGKGMLTLKGGIVMIN